jgi:hypothetical protein
LAGLSWEKAGGAAVIAQVATKAASIDRLRWLIVCSFSWDVDRERSSNCERMRLSAARELADRAVSGRSHSRASAASATACHRFSLSLDSPRGKPVRFFGILRAVLNCDEAHS